MPRVERAGERDADAVARELGVEVAAGLSDDEARTRLTTWGANELVTVRRRTTVVVFLRQFVNSMVLVLIAAAIVTAFIGESIDALAIGAIVVLNAVVGFVQEYRAQRALDALRRLETGEARVRREGQIRSIPLTTIVPGDVVELSVGDIVPADLRLCESRSLRIAEATLTGESEPSTKSVGADAEADLDPVVGHHNLAFKGTAVAFGHGAGVVIATGMRTQLGNIADLLETRRETPTPLQRRLSALARWMAVAAIVICVLVFVLGWSRGEPLHRMFITSVSLAIAAIPEGLPAVITVALALGARRMAERRAIVRTLVAVETLGSVNVICTDKTGTLTENRMSVERVWTPEGEFIVSGRGYEPTGHILGVSSDVQQTQLTRLGVAAALCNDAVLTAPETEGGSWGVIGDPTEGALLALAGTIGVDVTRTRVTSPRIEEIPFDAERRRMTTVHQTAHGYLIATKGALEEVLDLTDAPHEVLATVRTVAGQWAAEGMRVLALADRFTTSSPSILESSLTLVGLVGISDPPRAQAAAAVATCAAAGIRLVVITGDHHATAAAIARRIGIDTREGRILTGAQLATLDDAGLDEIIEEVSVYARAGPADKGRIVAAWQRRDAVVAMTGDGVNDAPALHLADIGVAMGVTGTQVSKEAADMVLVDDNFATIVDAVEEGRRIYDNIRRVVRYLLATNAGELWVMILAPLLGLPLPLLAVQILWMNLITDGLPAIALGLEPVELGTMRRPPRRRDETLFSGGLWQHVLWVGLVMAVVALVVQVSARALQWPWQTMVFTTLALTQLGHGLAIRSERRSTLRMTTRSNPWLYAIVAATVGAQILVVYVPVLQHVFATVALTAPQLVSVLVASSVVFFAVEVEKLVLRRVHRSEETP